VTALPDALRVLIAELRAEADELEVRALEAESIGLESNAAVNYAHVKSKRDAADRLDALLDASGREWLAMDSCPKSGEFLLGVWEGDWNNPRQRFAIYQATGYREGPSWSMKGHYRTEEGGAYKTAGWMPMIPAPTPTERNDG
jgi:hypothetical protein